MVATFTPNIQLTEPARGDAVGTWDTPVNSNTTLIDLVVGGIATIPLNNSNVVLSPAQFQSRMITFNSTLTGSVTITFATSFTKSYEIYHACTGSSAFTITLETTAAAGQVVAVPPGVITEVVNDGTNIKFKNLWGPIGTYFDWAGSSTPNWSDACTVPPLLACTGSSFSSATYPVLAGMIGTTLPDSRGRGRWALDAGVGRVSSAPSGVPGNTLFGAGGDQLTQNHTHGVTDPGHHHVVEGSQGDQAGFQPQFLNAANGPSNTVPDTTVMTGISLSAYGNGAAQNMPPVYVGGITLIRAG